MKLSVSLPEEDVAFVDEYAARTRAASRSSVLHEAIEMLRMAEIEADYVAAWDEWERSPDARLWDATAPDGLGDAAR
ncbi:MAG TPA: ribbon-helix-helix domain-containing protein [Micromonosporaceae bacterium]